MAGLTELELREISNKKIINRVINQHRNQLKKNSFLDERLAKAQTWLSKIEETS